MQVPSNIRDAVARQSNAAEVARQAQRRWCEAVACARNEKRHSLKDEKARLDMDVTAVSYLSRQGVTVEYAKQKASYYHRFNHPYMCALWVRVATKLNRRTS